MNKFTGFPAAAAALALIAGNWGPDEKLRVVFEPGRVVAVQQQKQ
jgi:hypothetical protein